MLALGAGALRCTQHEQPVSPPLREDSAPASAAPAVAPAPSSESVVAPPAPAPSTSLAEPAEPRLIVPVEAGPNTRVPASPALLNALSSEQRAQLTVLADLCETAVLDTKHQGVLAGCACCPPFEECPPVRGAAARGDVDAVFPLRTRSEGAFSAPGQRELSLTFDGCESHAENWGGTALYRPSAEGPWLLSYRSGARPDRCQPLRMRDGHDVLVCEWQEGHQSHEHFHVIVFDFTRSPESDWTFLVELSDSTVPGCWSEPGEAVVGARVTGFTLRDLNRDGILDVRVEGTLRQGSVSAEYLKRCGEHELAFERWLDRTGGKDPRTAPRARYLDLLGPTRRLVFEFITSNEGFEATPSTRKQLDALPED